VKSQVRRHTRRYGDRRRKFELYFDRNPAWLIGDEHQVVTTSPSMTE